MTSSLPPSFPQEFVSLFQVIWFRVHVKLRYLLRLLVEGVRQYMHACINACLCDICFSHSYPGRFSVCFRSICSFVFLNDYSHRRLLHVLCEEFHCAFQFPFLSYLLANTIVLLFLYHYSSTEKVPCPPELTEALENLFFLSSRPNQNCSCWSIYTGHALFGRSAVHVQGDSLS